METTKDIAFVIASQYELIRRIISTLPDSDLRSCAKVSSLWADAVRAERSSIRRLKPQLVSWIGSPERRSVCTTGGPLIVRFYGTGKTAIFEIAFFEDDLCSK